jgi:hypothetical protein
MGLKIKLMDDIYIVVEKDEINTVELEMISKITSPVNKILNPMSNIGVPDSTENRGTSTGVIRGPYKKNNNKVVYPKSRTRYTYDPVLKKAFIIKYKGDKKLMVQHSLEELGKQLDAKSSHNWYHLFKENKLDQIGTVGKPTKNKLDKTLRNSFIIKYEGNIKDMVINSKDDLNGYELTYDNAKYWRKIWVDTLRKVE